MSGKECGGSSVIERQDCPLYGTVSVMDEECGHGVAEKKDC